VCLDGLLLPTQEVKDVDAPIERDYFQPGCNRHGQFGDQQPAAILPEEKNGVMPQVLSSLCCAVLCFRQGYSAMNTVCYLNGPYFPLLLKQEICRLNWQAF
jgi:hypothetical protein